MTRTISTVMDHGLHPTFLVKTKKAASLRVTASHPFYRPSLKRYIKVSDLKAGDDLYHSNLGSVQKDQIVSIKATGKQERVYNIEVENTHNYFAEGILVHNFQK